MNKTTSAYYDFCNMTERSWTFEKMTDSEKARCFDALHFANVQGMVKGTYKTRWNILNAVYHAFLIGIGYSGFNWRDNSTDKSF